MCNLALPLEDIYDSIHRSKQQNINGDFPFMGRSLLI